ncbi:hypothetical protein Rsub_06271 [Raphidocelis subcapitata]|uniref:PBP domain-containing protein n=1 Tax=Raphidocelis subcapitata TaxID=307507 RepID=A0A2V0P100_9CHLO|nr:hypothetical protein Rsub_06271 [Raphidocelis subcapitata]|eukprot:GBF93551.1 hypothetical protein Rsub_06271 [Raphidocelis subcapitata]
MRPAPRAARAAAWALLMLVLAARCARAQEAAAGGGGGRRAARKAEADAIAVLQAAGIDIQELRNAGMTAADLESLAKDVLAEAAAAQEAAEPGAARAAEQQPQGGPAAAPAPEAAAPPPAAAVAMAPAPPARPMIEPAPTPPPAPPAAAQQQPEEAEKPKPSPSPAGPSAAAGPGPAIPPGVSLPISVHGSGAVGAAALIGRLNEDFQLRARPSVRVTYRATGDTVGQKEFVAGVNDYAISDYPLTPAGYRQMGDGPGNRTALAHIPFAFVPVSVFHSVPGAKGLTLFPCTLAKILKGDIKSWSNWEISRDNDGTKFAEKPILLVVPRNGSGATWGVTSYLHKACPEVWTSAASADWPASAAGTVAPPVNGSGDAVVAAIGSAPYSLGWAQSSEGYGAGLAEVALRNADNATLTAKTSDPDAAPQRLGAAMPQLNADWTDFQITNLPGKKTWPITLPVMLLAPTDMFMRPFPGRLLQAVVTQLLSDEVQGSLQDFGYIALPNATLKAVRQQAEGAIKANPVAPKWTFEDETEPVKGSYNFVISKMRGTWAPAAAAAASDAAAGVAGAEEALAAARKDIDSLRASAKRDKILYIALGATGAGLGLLGLLTAIGTAIGAHRAIRRSRFDRVPPIRAISKTYEDAPYAV